MPRYIDADSFLEKYGGWYTEEGTEEGFIGTIKGLVDAQPTLSPDDVRPVGKWRNKVMAVPGGHGQTYSRWGCSVCKKKFKERSNYCPGCGARMKGAENKP